MPFGSDKQEQIDNLTQEARGLRNRNADLEIENRELRNKLALAQAAHRLIGPIENALEKYYNGGDDGEGPLIIELARDEAQKEVIAQETEQLRADLKVGLVEKHGKDWATTYRDEHGPEIREQLHALFQTDGTYARAKKEAEKDVRGGIRAELVEEQKLQVQSELTAPDAKAAYITSIAGEVTESSEMAKYRRDLARDLQASWREEAEETAKSTIQTEEEAKEDGWKAEFTQTFLESTEGTRLRVRIRKGLEGEWKESSLKDIAAKLGDEELLDLLTLQAAQAREKLARETSAQVLLESFENTGVDMAKLKAGDTVEIYLGTVEETKKEKRYDSYSYDSQPNKTINQLVCKRKISLTTLGEGRFQVDEDSLLDTKSPYERDNGLEHGTVITLGRKVTENGKPHLEQRVTADVPLHYDNDTTDDEIIDAFFPVANIIINGVSARTIDEVKMA